MADDAVLFSLVEPCGTVWSSLSLPGTDTGSEVATTCAAEEALAPLRGTGTRSAENRSMMGASACTITSTLCS